MFNSDQISHMMRYVNLDILAWNNYEYFVYTNNMDIMLDIINFKYDKIYGLNGYYIVYDDNPYITQPLYQQKIIKEYPCENQIMQCMIIDKDTLIDGETYILNSCLIRHPYDTEYFDLYSCYYIKDNFLFKMQDTIKNLPKEKITYYHQPPNSCYC